MPKHKKISTSLIKDAQLDFYFDLHNKGIEIPEEFVLKLKKAGYLEKDPHPVNRKKIRVEPPRKFVDKRLVEQKADSFLDVVNQDLEEGESSSDYLVDIKEEKAYEQDSQSPRIEYSGKKKIITSDWKIPYKEKLNWSKEFYNWINSINKGFLTRKNYPKLNLYVQQSEMWLGENISLSDFNTQEDRFNYIKNTEIPRCQQNTLYFLNKYLYLKEGNINGGGHKYSAWPVHEIICYLFDNHISMMIGKGRQIGSTTTIAGCFLKRAIFNKNYFIKFITEDESKGEEIFADKIKFPLSHLSSLKPGVLNDRDNLLWFGYKSQKGTYSGVNSKIQVSAPKPTAINGGSPDLVGIDEIGNIRIFSEMLMEGRPALFGYDAKSKRQVMRRQVVCWGTAGNVDKGGGDFETEYTALLSQWEEKNFNAGIVPIFFDCFAREGFREADYEKEKKIAYSKKGDRGKRSRIQFHQHYPRSIPDMFLTSSKTLLDVDEIHKHLQRIQSLPHNKRVVYGKFEPTFDRNTPMQKGFNVPYKVTGSVFVPLEDDDPNITCFILNHPEKNWADRYFQGTDPIMTDTGLSNMASAIWDSNLNKIVAGVRFRPNYHQDAYLQCMLMNMYFQEKSEHQVPELIESNIGTGYINYKSLHGQYPSVLPNSMLPVYLQGGGSHDGINKNRTRTGRILDVTKEFIYSYIDNQDIEEIFIELRTYVGKPTSTGFERFEPMNRKTDRDDFLDACTYSYLASKSVGRLPQNKRKLEGNPKKVKYEFVYNKNYTLTRKKKMI